MKQKTFCNSQIINAIAFGFSLFFLISSFAATIYTREWGSVLHNWYLIMITPCPLVTDYLEIGGLAASCSTRGPAAWHAFSLW